MDITMKTSDLVHELEIIKERFNLYQLGIGGIEISQATQYYRAAEHLTDLADRGPDNSICLVAGKPAWVRVYLWSLWGISGVTGTLEVQRRSHGFHWSTIATLNPEAPALNTVPALSATSFATARATLNQTLNFIIPANEMIGTLRLVARVGAGSLSAEHTTTVPVTLRQTLGLAGVMIEYDGPASNAPGAPNLQINPPTLTDLTGMAATALTLFPVQSTAQFRVAGTLQLNEHLQDTTFPTSGCGAAWDRLVGQVANARTADGNQPGFIYYGLLPTGVPMGPVGGGGGGGVAVGPINAPGTLAHEAGHAAGLGHAPAGGAPNPDPSYPAYEPYDPPSTPQASIGEYGLNVNDGAIASPQLFRDFMAYGGPAWISPYHYGKLLNNAILSPVTVGVDSPWWKDIVFEEYKKWPWIVDPDPPPWLLELPMFPPDYPLEDVISLIVRVERGVVAEVMHVARTKVRTHIDQAKHTQLVARLLDSKNEILAQGPLLRLERQPSGCENCDVDKDGQPTSYLAQAFVPDVAPGAALEIGDGETVLWRREAPKQRIRIKKFNAKLAGRAKTKDVLQLDWSMSGGAEELWVRWSADGETWRSLITGLTGEKVRLAASTLPAGQIRLQLVAHDGFFSTYSKTVNLKILERPPEVSILHPIDGRSYVAGQTLRLWGVAAGRGEEQIPPDQAVWLLGKKRIGKGLDAWTSLDPGEHTLTLKVKTETGTASTDVKITVSMLPKPDG